MASILALPFAAVTFLAQASWSAPLQFSASSVDASGNTGYFANLAIGVDGTIHAAYFDRGSGKIKYRQRQPPAGWGVVEVVADGRDPPYLSVALGPDGTVHLAFFSLTPPCNGVCHAKRSLAGAWSVDSVDSAPGAVQTAVAVDAAGSPHVAYGGASGELKYALGSAGAWTIETVDATANVAPELGGDEARLRLISLALGPAGNPRVAYYNDALNQVRYAERSGLSWGSPEIVGPSGLAMMSVSLALDGQGRPHVATVDMLGSRVVHAEKSASVWQVSDAAVSSPGLEPSFSVSLALDGNGLPAAAFHNNSDENARPALGLLGYDGISWSTMTADDSAGGAVFVSLAMDSAGNPHVLYGDPDPAYRELRYASATAAGFGAPVGGGPGSLVQAPTGFVAAAVHYTSVAWTWSDNSSNETSFALYGSTASGGPFSLVASVPAGQNSYSETGLIHSTSYYRYAAAANAGGAAVSSMTVAWTLAAQAASVSGGSGQTLTYAAPDGGVALVIPEGAFPVPVNVSFSVPREYPAGESSAGSLAATGAGVEITAVGGLQPARELLITVGYCDASVAGMDEYRLALARYDVPARKWVPLKSAPEPALNRVTGRTSHLSVFQVMQAGDASDLSRARAFPNPLRPSLGQNSMTFTGLPPGALLRITAFSGEKAADLTADAAGMASWDGRNLKGDRAASGVYMVLLEHERKRRILKVAIQR